MTNATSVADVYSVSKIKTMQGRQGEAWSATLLRNGNAVASVTNEANGGAFRFYWMDQMHGQSAEETLWNAHVEAERARIPVNAVLEEESREAGFELQMREFFNAEMCIERMVNDALDSRRWKRLCKTKTLFQVGKNIGGPDIKMVKGIGPDIRAWVERKFPGEKIRFLNDEYQE